MRQRAGEVSLQPVNLASTPRASNPRSGHLPGVRPGQHHVFAPVRLRIRAQSRRPEGHDRAGRNVCHAEPLSAVATYLANENLLATMHDVDVNLSAGVI